MAKKEDTTEHEPLTEEQRITALEEKVGTNKIVLFGMALFLIIAVSIASTFFVVSLFSEDETIAEESETVVALQTKVTELEKTIEALIKSNKNLRSELALLNEKLANSSNLKLQQILIEQEAGHQTFLEALRSGMYDLAHMLPGSRTWLEVYGEKVDKAERLSKEREKQLINIQKGKVSEIQAQEDPFAEGF